jgi:hypothetical protein
MDADRQVETFGSNVRLIFSRIAKCLESMKSTGFCPGARHAGVEDQKPAGLATTTSDARENVRAARRAQDLYDGAHHWGIQPNAQAAGLPEKISKPLSKPITPKILTFPRNLLILKWR